MKQTTRIICITLCVLLIALSAAGVIWALYNKFASNEAHAEYADLAGTDTLVNFNQLITTQLNFTNTTTDNRNYFQCAVMYNNGVWYSGSTEQIGYFDFILTSSSNNTAQLVLKHSGSTRDIQIYSQSLTIVNGHKYYFRMNILGVNPSVVGGLTIKDFIVIDLTLMFGGNEPNLQQAREYFTADYYNYNAGTPIPYSKDYLEGYQDGANDLYDSMTITYNAYTIGSTSATYANNTIERGQIIFDQQYGVYMFSGVIGVNLMGNVERGTNFDIDFEIYIPDLQGENNPSYAESNYFLHFAYVDENNVLNDITTLTGHYIGSLTIEYKGSFVLPLTTSTIYIYVDYNTIGENYSPTQCFAFKSEMTFKSTDMGLLMNNAYQRGYNAAAASYYQGTENYNAIYNLGYQNGLATQNATLGAMEYIGAAFTGIGSILQIELLPGVPFSLFILLPLMFGLIAFVVKLSKGGD